MPAEATAYRRRNLLAPRHTAASASNAASRRRAGNHATSAGGHFNPGSHQHGGPEHAAHHGGDFGNITADASGKARLSLSVPTSQISLDDGAANSVIGRGIIVHADPDDFVTQPTGNAGKRLACGVVVAGK